MITLPVVTPSNAKTYRGKDYIPKNAKKHHQLDAQRDVTFRFSNIMPRRTERFKPGKTEKENPKGIKDAAWV